MHFQEKPAIRIVPVDDHELIRVGLRTLFKSEPDLQIIGEASNFNDGLRLAQKLIPDVILLEMKMEEDFVTERIPELLSFHPSCKILVLTASTDHEMHLLALRLGAVGVFIKSQSNSLLLKAIHSVYRGEVWFDKSLASDLLENFKQNTSSAKRVEPPTENRLTERELDIARLAVRGLPAKKIAAQLFISEKTVRNQLVFIYSKLNVSSQVELVLQAGHLNLLLGD
jgi:DNA-binding NarL/FixJ family response regulator